MKHLEVLTSDEAKELHVRESLINPFDELHTPWQLGYQKLESPRVLELINYRISKRTA